MQEVITVFVRVDQSFAVKGQTGGATMLLFSGYAEGENFKGRILPGAVDCQKTDINGFTLSARYILEGEDKEGKNCKIFRPVSLAISLIHPLHKTYRHLMGFLSIPSMHGLLL